MPMRAIKCYVGGGGGFSPNYALSFIAAPGGAGAAG
jgi:hypothetical protein